jgi:hypothetical protein
MPVSGRALFCARAGSPVNAPCQRGPGQRPTMNNPRATCVLPDMRTHKPERQTRRARQDDMRDTPGRRYRWWRPRRRRDRGRASRTPSAGTDGGQTMTGGAIQMAIGLLTASLDSPELEAWAVWALIPEDPAALGDLIAGLHTISGLLLHELHEATGQPPPATLQRLAILAETRPGTPSAG